MISFFIPEDAYFLRNCLNNIADLSEKTVFYNLAARISALAIPIISLFNVLSFAARGQFKGALKLIAFTVISAGWALAGLAAGSRILTLFRQIVKKAQIPQKELQEIRLINERLLDNIATAEGAIDPLKGRIRYLTAENDVNQANFQQQLDELRQQNQAQAEQLAAQQLLIAQKDEQQALSTREIANLHALIVQKDHEIEGFAPRIEALEGQIIILRTAAIDQEREIGVKLQQIAEKERTILLINQSIDQTKAERDQLRVEKQYLEDQNLQLEQSNHNLKEAINLKTHFLEVKKSLITALTEDKNKIEEEAKALRASDQALAQNIAEKELLIAQQSAEIARLNQSLAALTEDNQAQAEIIQKQSRKIVSLNGRVLDLNYRVEQQDRKIQEEQQAHRTLCERIEALTLESEKAKAGFERIFEELNSRDTRIEKLFELDPEKAQKWIEGLDQEIFDLRAAKERTERQKQDILEKAIDWDDISTDLNKSVGGISAPAHNFAAFDPLVRQLMAGEFGPVVSKDQALAFCPKRKGEPRDPFTTSVLSYLLLKGYQKFIRPPTEDQAPFTIDDFKALFERIENIYNTTKVENETLENKSLKENLSLCRSVIKIPPGEPLCLDQKETINSVFELLIHKKPWPKHIVRLPFFEKVPVIEKLKTAFGEQAVNNALSYYKLSTGSWSEKEVLALFVSLSANMTLDTAIHIFGKVDESELIRHITEMRDLVYHFADNNKIVPDVEWDQQFKKDLESLRVMNLVAHAGDENVLDQYPLGRKQARAAALEHLGRDLPYCFFDTAFSNWNPHGSGLSKITDGTLVAIGGIKPKPSLFKTRIIIRDSGIYGVTLVPVNPKEANEAFVLFRGTFDGGSIRRDLNPTERTTAEVIGLEGPGGRTFSQRSAEILKNVSEHLQDASEVEHVTFVGHSLGGSDATRLLSAILNSNGSLLSRAKKVDLVTLNSPHVEKTTRDAFIKGVKALPECQFSVTHLEGKNDAVSSVGTCRVAHCGEEKPKNLETETIVFEQKKAQFSIWFFDFVSFIVRGYNRHTTPWLTRGADPTVSNSYQEHLEAFIARQQKNYQPELAEEIAA